MYADVMPVTSRCIFWEIKQGINGHIGDKTGDKNVRFESYIHDKTGSVKTIRNPIESSIIQHDSYNSGPCFFYLH